MKRARTTKESPRKAVKMSDSILVDARLEVFHEGDSEPSQIEKNLTLQDAVFAISKYCVDKAHILIRPTTGSKRHYDMQILPNTCTLVRIRLYGFIDCDFDALVGRLKVEPLTQIYSLRVAGKISPDINRNS